jgi:hypothetical protein
MSKNITLLPPIERYPHPVLESAEYVFVARPGIVAEDTWWNPDDIFVEQPTIEEFLKKAPASELEDPSTSKLCWVEFFQKAVIRIRHPERFEGDKPGPSNFFSNGESQQVEKIHGNIFPAASPQLVTDATQDRFAFATVEDILYSGTVTPHMAEWMKRYSQEDSTGGFNRFLIPLLPLLTPELRTALKTNKFSSIDFED